MEYLQYARNWDSLGDAAGRDSPGWSRKKTYEIVFHVICNPDIAENFFPMEMLSNFEPQFPNLGQSKKLLPFSANFC